MISRQICFSVPEEFTGVRLDQCIMQWLDGVSRARISSAINEDLIQVDGQKKKSSYRLKGGEQIQGRLCESPPLQIVPQKIDFPVLFEDEWLLLLSKPPGLVVHPGSGISEGTLVNGLVYYYHQLAEVGGDSLRPGIVHRLDKDTSGIMVVAKNGEVHTRLVDCFKNHQLEKEYLVLVHGYVNKGQGRIVEPIGRHPVARQKMAVNRSNGKYAASAYQVLTSIANKYSLLRVKIQTGRTHQIRVHMAHIGHPVVGDVVYGGGRKVEGVPRQLLHAYRLAFTHPVTEQFVDYCAPLWSDFKEILLDHQLNLCELAIL